MNAAAACETGHQNLSASASVFQQPGLATWLNDAVSDSHIVARTTFEYIHSCVLKIGLANDSHLHQRSRSSETSDHALWLRKKVTTVEAEPAQVHCHSNGFQLIGSAAAGFLPVLAGQDRMCNAEHCTRRRVMDRGLDWENRLSPLFRKEKTDAWRKLRSLARLAATTVKVGRGNNRSKRISSGQNFALEPQLDNADP